MDNAKELLKEKIEDCYARLNEKWHEMSKDELIRKAVEIAAVKSVYAELDDLVSDEEAKVLLRYDDPLSVVSDIFNMGEPDDCPEFRGDFKRVMFKITELTDVDISELGYKMAV